MENPHIHVKIPDSITGEKRWALENALVSSAFEGQENPKVQQMVVDYIASGRSTDDIVKEIVEQAKKNPSAYLKQFR
ncbi:MAG: hypothetical protein LBH40_03145 [Alphaproteobacteria bacterium]|jgi:hypothetical protein|nr:hypothetical protein [Alphaproteobacteria bacterium]